MRKLLYPLLMASVLMPAAANAYPGNRGERSHGERSERSESNDSKSQDRPQRAERPERSNNDAPRVHVERAARPERAERTEQTQQVQQVQQVEQVQRAERVRRGDRNNDSVADAFRRIGEQQNAQQQGTVQVHRDGNRDGFDGLHDRIVRNGDRVDSNKRWSRDWRQNSRYNWYNYRSRYGSLYRLGRYNDPYGYGYRRFSIGFNLWPSYYGSNYWLNDPWQYRLPPAYGPYRWVRYYDDALLVNIYTGQVVDVINNFFW